MRLNARHISPRPPSTGKFLPYQYNIHCLKPISKEHLLTRMLHRPGNDSPKIAALYKAGPSKSFTANTTALSHLHLAAESSDSTIGAQITPEDVEYTSNAQFQNRVELYRGRCGSSCCAEEMPSVMYVSIALAALSSCNSRHMAPCPSPANCAS